VGRLPACPKRRAFLCLEKARDRGHPARDHESWSIYTKELHSVVSKLKCPLFAASEMSGIGFKVVASSGASTRRNFILDTRQPG